MRNCDHSCAGRMSLKKMEDGLEDAVSVCWIG